MKKENVKRLFLLDVAGALLSAILLGIVLVQLDWLIGIPRPTLHLLAAIPCFFAVYDMYCYFKIEKDIGKFLKGIAIMNILYCCLSIILAFLHFQEMLFLGWVYIIVEVIIVVSLAVFELRVASAYVSSNV